MKFGKILAMTAVAAAAMWAPSASASVLFSDDFNSYAPQLNWVPPAVWAAPAPGTVDLIGVGSGYDYFPGNGGYVDLNGSNQVAGVLQTLQSFAAGTYTISFSLGGNSVGPGYGDVTAKTTTISLGNWSTDLTLAASAPLTQYSFSVATNGGVLSFAQGSESPAWPNNNIGNILDNVTVSSVPEPATWISMLLGFGLLGFALRGRKVSSGAAIA